jgi:hypothetical protein
MFDSHLLSKRAVHGVQKAWVTCQWVGKLVEFPCTRLSEMSYEFGTRQYRFLGNFHRWR